MRSLARRFLGGTTLALVAGVSVAQAQTTYPNVKVTGRLQEQFYYFGNEDYAATVGPQSNFFTRRARIEARGNISENVVVYIQPSFEGGRNLSNVVTTCTSSAVPAALREIGFDQNIGRTLPLDTPVRDLPPEDIGPEPGQGSGVVLAISPPTG